VPRLAAGREAGRRAESRRPGGRPQRPADHRIGADYGGSDCRYRFAVLLNDATRSEHRVGVGRGLRDRLDHVPVLDDLAAFQAEDVHHRLSARIIGQTVPMRVKDDVVAVDEDTLDLAMSIWMVRYDKGNELLHAFHPVFDERT